MKELILLICNTLTLSATLFLNYLAGSGSFHGQTIGAVSARYPTLLSPADYAFSIWGFIYFLLIAFVGYQWFAYFKNRNEDSLNKAGIWFSLANIANGLWVIAFVNEDLGLSVLFIFLLLFILIVLLVRLKLEVWDAPLRIIVFVWWPICFYIGWIILATVSNVAVYLKSMGWQGGALSPEAWAIIMILLATLIYLFLIFRRNMREAALVGVWGLLAIASKQWEAQEGVVITSITAALILFISVAYHGLKNKDSSPFVKLRQKEF